MILGTLIEGIKKIGSSNKLKDRISQSDRRYGKRVTIKIGGIREAKETAKCRRVENIVFFKISMHKGIE